MNKKFIFTLFGIILIIVACTNKKSPFGIQYEYVIESDTLSNIFSFTESYEDTIHTYYEDPTLVVGSFHDVIGKGVFRFLSLPDTTWLDTVQIDTCKIRIVKRNQFGDDFDIEIKHLEKKWLESTVTWDTLNNYIGEEITTFSTAVDTSLGDTITFSFDKEVVGYWIENDTINYGIIFSPPQGINSFAEFYSSETDYNPQLQIIYTKSTGILDTLFFGVTKDAYIAKNFNSSSSDYGMIANLPPTRMRFSLNKEPLIDSLFAAISDSILLDPEAEKISINYAELIFDSTNIDSSFTSSSYLDIAPFYITDTLNLSYDNVPGISISDFDSGEEFFKVNITGITQGIIRSSFEYDQFLLKSVYENIDFSFLRFKEDFNPKLRIVFTYNIDE